MRAGSRHEALGSRWDGEGSAGKSREKGKIQQQPPHPPSLQEGQVQAQAAQHLGGKRGKKKVKSVLPLPEKKRRCALPMPTSSSSRLPWACVRSSSNGERAAAVAWGKGGRWCV